MGKKCVPTRPGLGAASCADPVGRRAGARCTHFLLVNTDEARAAHVGRTAAQTWFRVPRAKGVCAGFSPHVPSFSPGELLHLSSVDGNLRFHLERNLCSSCLIFCRAARRFQRRCLPSTCRSASRCSCQGSLRQSREGWAPSPVFMERILISGIPICLWRGLLGLSRPCLARVQ